MWLRHHRPFLPYISEAASPYLVLPFQQPSSVRQQYHPRVSTQVSSLVQSRACSQHYKPFRLPNLSTSSKAALSTTADKKSSSTAGSTLHKFKPSPTPSSANMADSNDTYSVVFEHNSQWRRNLADSQPELFEKLGKGQSPQILWIGCADSRCPETTILGLQPGDIFTHRNIANILIPTDLNSLAVIQYAVQYLQVKHIIVCGHTSCGGVAAALDNKKLGLIDTWLMPLRLLRQQNAALLESMDPKEAGLKLVDLNVRASVSTLLQNATVIDAMVERDLKIHGVIYNIGTGELNELDIDEDDKLVAERRKAFKTG